LNLAGFSERMVSLRELVALHSQKILLGAVSIVVICLVLPPIAILLFSSIRSTANRLPFEVTTFTVANYLQVFTSGATYRMLLNTAWFASGTIIVAMGLSIIFAWFLERTNVPFRRLLFVLILSPMGMPVIIVGMGWILLANPANGLFNVILRELFGLTGPGPINIYSIPGMILIAALGFVPMIYIMISGVFSRVDPSLEEAARTSGAGIWATFRQVSMPLVSPAVFAAVIYYFVRAMEIFEIPALLGMPKGIYVFSSAIYYAINPAHGELLPNYGMASTYGVILLAVAGVFVYLYSRYIKHGERFATVTGRGYRPHLIDLGRWKFVPVVIMTGYFVLAVAMPFLILFWTSIAPAFTAISFSALSRVNLNAYREMMNSPQLWIALNNTIIIAISAAMIGMFLVTLVSWLSIRGEVRGAWIPDRLAFMVVGVPGIVLALALIFIYTVLPIPIYGTIWIIVIAVTTTCLPFGTRQMGAAFIQIHRELEEAAGTSGAKLWHTFSRVVLPLLWPSFVRGFLWMFVRSIRDTSIALMLYAVGNQTLGVILWFLWMEEAEFRIASAIAVPLVMVTMALTFLVARQTMVVEGG